MEYSLGGDQIGHVRMKLEHKIIFAIRLLNAILFKRRIALFVGWMLTTRCNKQCKYCDLWNKKEVELDAGTVVFVIGQLSRLGTKFISFSGGEPLLRDDIREIIDCASAHKMYVKINSNGALFAQKAQMLKKLDEIRLSLDGPEEIQDELRGRGSYRETIAAAKDAKKNMIKVSFNAVLSKYNLTYLNFILDVAKKFDAKVTFQPATSFLLGGDKVNPCAPLRNDYRRAIAMLINAKKANRHIANSFSGLSYLYHWPYAARKMHCYGGRFGCRIEVNGNVTHCGIYRHKEGNGNLQDYKHMDFKSAFQRIEDIYCSDCWCAPDIEMNYLISLKPEVLWNSLFSW